MARAFTAFQHHSLVRKIARSTADSALVVGLYAAFLYRDDGVPDREADDPLEASLTVSAELADVFDFQCWPPRVRDSPRTRSIPTRLRSAPRPKSGADLTEFGPVSASPSVLNVAI